MVASRRPDREAEHALIARAKSGCRSAFDALAEPHYDDIRRFLTDRTDDPDLADDLTQQTFIDAHRNIAAFDESRSLAGWLHGIAKRHLYLAFRRGQQRRLVSLERLTSAYGLDGVARRLGLVTADGAATYVEWEAIERVVRQLSAEEQEVFVLRHVYQLTGPEVAAALGISPEAARQRISRANRRFRDLYPPTAGRWDDE